MSVDAENRPTAHAKKAADIMFWSDATYESFILPVCNIIRRLD
jgi:hypothetical protein